MKTKIRNIGFKISLLLLPFIGKAYDIEVDGLYYNVNTNNKTASVTWGGTFYTSSTPGYRGNIIIPPSIKYGKDDFSVTEIGNNAFNGCSGLTSITIPNSVTKIGMDAFNRCSGLTSITIPNSVTAIRQDAFRDCSGLTSVKIGNSVTFIGVDAFCLCTKLNSVTIPNSVRNIKEGAFSYCSSLKNLKFEDGDVVLSFNNEGYTPCFYGCPLQSIYLGRNLSYKLNYLGIVESNYSGNSPFYKKTSLKELTIGDSVTEIGRNAFFYCSGLTSVTIGNSVTYIGESAFSGCSGLTSVTIPNSVTEIGKHAFWGCKLNNVKFDDGNRVLKLGNACFHNNPISNVYFGREMSGDVGQFNSILGIKNSH